MVPPYSLGTCVGLAYVILIVGRQDFCLLAHAAVAVHWQCDCAGIVRGGAGASWSVWERRCALGVFAVGGSGGWAPGVEVRVCKGGGCCGCVVGWFDPVREGVCVVVVVRRAGEGWRVAVWEAWDHWDGGSWVGGWLGRLEGVEGGGA